MTDISRLSEKSIKFKSGKSPVLDITDSTLNQIRMLSLSSSRKETGGILVGFNQGRDIRVTGASDPGPNADRSATHFLRDTRYCRTFLGRVFQETGADYVGEWHSHVVALRTLSGGDLRTLAGIFIDPEYDFVSFVVILVVVHKKATELVAYVAEREFKRRRRVVLSEIYRGAFPTSEAIALETAGAGDRCDERNSPDIEKSKPQQGDE
jgi:integrative and conjugative element protein (TIGR02256 family)